MQIRSELGRLCAKLLTDRQTDRQTNNDENITSLAEVINPTIRLAYRETITWYSNSNAVMLKDKTKRKTSEHVKYIGLTHKPLKSFRSMDQLVSSF